MSKPHSTLKGAKISAFFVGRIVLLYKRKGGEFDKILIFTIITPQKGRNYYESNH